MVGFRQAIVAKVQSLPPELAVLLVSALPVVELRGAIPLGFAMGLTPVQSFLLAVIGNLLPVPFLLLLLEPLAPYLQRIPLLGNLVRWFRRRAMCRSGEVERLGLWGLVIFVAVPLPSTGAWTGATIAALLGYPWRPALLAVTLGVVLAGIVVTVFSALGWFLAS